MEGSNKHCAVQAVLATYRKAPITISLFASYFVSQLVSKLWLDYRLFIALPGGPLPKNVLGWLVHYLVLSPLSLHSSWTGSKLVRAFLPRTKKGQSTQSDADHLTTGVRIPSRQGPAPTCAGTVPHRQLNQFCSGSHGDEETSDSAEGRKQAQEAVEHVLSSMQKLAEAQPSHLRTGSSLIESHSTALFAVSHTLVTGSDNVSRSTRSARFPSTLSRRFLGGLKGEFVHVHCTSSQDRSEPASASPIDGSMHMTLHPDDAALIVKQGWGVLHSLAGFPSYSGFWIGWPAWLTRVWPSSTRSARWWSSSAAPTAEGAKVSKGRGLPPTYCLVYSPRNMDEARVVCNIIDASLSFAVGSRPQSRE